MSETVGSFYQKNRDVFNKELQSVSKKIKRFAWYRLFAFCLIFPPLFVFNVSNPFTISGSVVIFVFFFYLVKLNFQFEKRKKKLTELIKITENELLALQHTFSQFKNGNEFLDTNHFFSYDLDLFGEGSVFQFLNRTSTQCGGNKLANWLLHPSKEKETIQKIQDAVQELAKIPEWRLQFLASGNLFQETTEMSREIKSWSGMELKLKNISGIKWLIRIVPALTILSLIPAVLGYSFVVLEILVLLQWTLLGFTGKRVLEYFGFFGKKSDLLAKYMELLKFIEEREFHSEFLSQLQNKVRQPVPASKIFHQLKSLVKEFEYSGNLLVGSFLNSLFLWNIRCVYKLWDWHRNNHYKLAEWLNVIAETDALISLANYANNHPDFCYPEMDTNGFTFKAEELGHPLLNPYKRVCNNLEINGWSKVLIVTGANMAGKSTFLRTVGVNIIFARLGIPVCAKKMVLTPIEIYTNMRTTDSLLRDESYFFAELKRIKGVLDRLQTGERIFIILDEMLKGTNSVDKLNGSRELIRKLIELKSVSLVATHDLKLSEMETEFPQNILNKCFEIRIENDELVFDYKLSAGVTKTMNATFLMKKMGII